MAIEGPSCVPQAVVDSQLLVRRALAPRNRRYQRMFEMRRQDALEPVVKGVNLKSGVGTRRPI